MHDERRGPRAVPATDMTSLYAADDAFLHEYLHRTVKPREIDGKTLFPQRVFRQAQWRNHGHVLPIFRHLPRDDAKQIPVGVRIGLHRNTTVHQRQPVGRK